MTMERASLGVLGGMGPLSSAEFMCTLYERARGGGAEQNLPSTLLLSDPTLPDRSQSLLSGNFAALRDGIERGLRRLSDWGCDQLVICCFTAHYLLPHLSLEMQTRLISLVDLVFRDLAIGSHRRLILCSSATRKLELLQSHSGWSAVGDRCLFPDDADQEQVNRIIFDIKSNGASDAMLAVFNDIVTRYPVEHCVIACSELHMLNRAMDRKKLVTPARRFDPLDALARDVAARVRSPR